MNKITTIIILFTLFGIILSFPIILEAKDKTGKMSQTDLIHLTDSFYVYVKENIETGETEGKKEIYLSSTPVDNLKGLKSLKLYFPNEKPFEKFGTRFLFQNATDLQKFFDPFYSQEEIEVFKQDSKNPIYQIKYKKIINS